MDLGNGDASGVEAMGRPFEGVINVDVRDSVPDWAPYLQPLAPQGAPNVVYIVLDDVGFSAMEPWGGLIETPNINRLAGNGLTYTNWHTTALCSPTRSSLLTGRNHTTNGMACIAEATTGTLSLFINDEKVGEGRIMTQPGNFSLVGEGLNVGKDPGEPVTADYPGTSPFAFTGGRIVKAIVDVSGEPFIDLEKEAVAMMARE